MSDPTNTPRSPDESSRRSDDPNAEAAEPNLPSTRRSGLLGGRMMAATAAVAVGLVAAVVIVNLTNDPDESVDASDPVEIAAEDGDASGTGDAGATNDDSTEGGTSGDDAAAGATTWEVATTGDFEVTLEPAEAGLATVTVSDPTTPVLAEDESQHCVLVTLTGPTTVETYGCAGLLGNETVELVLSAPGDPLVGCAAVATNQPPAEPTAVEASTTFLVSADAGLPAGDYELTVEAITGAGDGCPPADGVTEHEATAEATITID